MLDRTKTTTATLPERPAIELMAELEQRDNDWTTLGLRLNPRQVRWDKLGRSR